MQSSAVAPDEICVAVLDRLMQVAPDGTDVVVHLLHFGFCSPQHLPEGDPG
jgi:hypothetical protein